MDGRRNQSQMLRKYVDFRTAHKPVACFFNGVLGSVRLGKKCRVRKKKPFFYWFSQVPAASKQCRPSAPQSGLPFRIVFRYVFESVFLAQ